jgi:transposase
MSNRTVPLELVPQGLVVDHHEIGTARIVIHAHGASATSVCPTCGLASSSLHSHYERSLGDFPAHGRRLGIRLAARRFRCRNAACERQVFTERFAPDLIQAHARRTSRLEVVLHAIGLALGGRPGERLAARLSMPVCADTLLRLLRRLAPSTPSDVRVVGIDDFAWLKGHRYGTIICDLERRCTIDLLPDRVGGTVADWLASHPGIEIVCRDRGSGYREGAAKGAPQALQIADRWHLLENATAAFVETVKRHMGDLRRAITGGDIDPETLSAAEKVQWAGWQRRDEMNGHGAISQGPRAQHQGHRQDDRRVAPNRAPHPGRDP